MSCIGPLEKSNEPLVVLESAGVRGSRPSAVLLRVGIIKPREIRQSTIASPSAWVIDAEFEHQIGRAELEAIGATHRLPCGSLDRANATAG